MVKKSLILALCILALFLVSCAAEKSTVTQAAEPSQSTVTPTKTSTTTPAPAQQMTAEVKALLELHKNIKSVRFTKDPSLNPQTFYIKGDKYKKTIAQPGRYSEPSENYDIVYVDREAQKAYAYCSDLSAVKCPEQYRTDAYEHEFKSEDVILPSDMLSSITYAEKIGKETIENRQITIIQYTNRDGQKERLSIDTYYGFVFKQLIYDANDQVVESHSFTNVAFNSLTDSDVSLPEGLQIK